MPRAIPIMHPGPRLAGEEVARERAGCELDAAKSFGEFIAEINRRNVDLPVAS